MVMGVRRGGGARGGTCPPPPWKFKNMGPHKDNLTRKNLKKKIKKLSEETDMRGPPIISKETDMRGPPYSMRSNLSKEAPT